jgi:hypothetical protein
MSKSYDRLASVKLLPENARRLRAISISSLAGLSLAQLTNMAVSHALPYLETNTPRKVKEKGTQ